MLQKIKNRKQEGFTIIEVLIVLAIAGLIMLIVFLAVPALNRNNRNTTIKNSASAVAGGISEFVSNNNGSMPDTIAQSAAEVTISSTASGSTASQAKVNGSLTVAEGTAAPTTADNIVVIFGQKCNGDTSSRSAAVWYSVEKSSGVGSSCVDS